MSIARVNKNPKICQLSVLPSPEIITQKRHQFLGLWRSLNKGFKVKGTRFG